MKDKVVIITGASSGIGKALTLELGKAGAKLVLAARNSEALQELAAQCPNTLAVPTDVSKESDCKALVEKTISHFGRIDALVNNAGISMQVNFDEIKDLSLFQQIMDVNYFGAVYCTYHALAHLKQSRGLIVAISSITGKMGVPTRSAYAASKHALQGFFDSLRIELIGTGVDVSVLSPGFVQSEVRQRALGADAKPMGKSKIEETGLMSAEECARQIHQAMQKRSRDVIIADGIRSKLAPFLKLLFPKLVDTISLKAIQSGRS